MTRTSVHWRMIHHLKGQKAKYSSNPLYRHDEDIHNGDTQIYRTRILTGEKNLLPLCISEGIYIEKQNENHRMNECNENGRGGLIRLTANRIS